MEALPDLEQLEFSPVTAALESGEGGSTEYDSSRYLIALNNQGQVEQLLADAQGRLVCADEAQCQAWGLEPNTARALVIGRIAGQVYQVLLWNSQTSLPPQIAGYQWLGLRTQLETLTPGQFSLAGRALQLAQWFYNHAFCGRCGRPTEVYTPEAQVSADPGEHQRRCLHCQLSFYPRITPCMIALIVRGPELLLAYHQRASRPVFSLLAGHVEAGENLEQCVRREVREEVGVELGNITYVTSQAWPFPGQLMLAVIAQYDSGELQPDASEIREAAWFRYDQLPLVPPTATVAGQLIEQYVRQCRQQWG